MSLVRVCRPSSLPGSRCLPLLLLAALAGPAAAESVDGALAVDGLAGLQACALPDSSAGLIGCEPAGGPALWAQAPVGAGAGATEAAGARPGSFLSGVHQPAASPAAAASPVLEPVDDDTPTGGLVALASVAAVMSLSLRRAAA